jgi:23S rRNA pseudouridine955/2504/2580 synthase
MALIVYSNNGACLKRITVLFENDHLLILNKPAGLAVQGGKGIKVSLDDLLAEAYSPRPLLVHRLDKDTSGIILVAKNRGAAGTLAPLFEERTGVKKHYLAVCAGSFARKSGNIQERLLIRGLEKEALTSYVCTGENGEYSRAELELGSGRTHQIRRHLARLGNPVLGDDKYGDFSLNRRLRKTMDLRRLLLHASRIVVAPLPRLGLKEALDVQSPPPDYFGPFLSLFSR